MFWSAQPASANRGAYEIIERPSEAHEIIKQRAAS